MNRNRNGNGNTRKKSQYKNSVYANSNQLQENFPEIDSQLQGLQQETLKTAKNTIGIGLKQVSNWYNQNGQNNFDNEWNQSLEKNILSDEGEELDATALQYLLNKNFPKDSQLIDSLIKRNVENYYKYAIPPGTNPETAQLIRQYNQKNIQIPDEIAKTLPFSRDEYSFSDDYKNTNHPPFEYYSRCLRPIESIPKNISFSNAVFRLLTSDKIWTFYWTIPELISKLTKEIPPSLGRILYESDFKQSPEISAIIQNYQNEKRNLQQQQQPNTIVPLLQPMQISARRNNPRFNENRLKIQTPSLIQNKNNFSNQGENKMTEEDIQACSRQILSLDKIFTDISNCASSPENLIDQLNKLYKKNPVIADLVVDVLEGYAKPQDVLFRAALDKYEKSDERLKRKQEKLNSELDSIIDQNQTKLKILLDNIVKKSFFEITKSIESSIQEAVKDANTRIILLSSPNGAVPTLQSIQQSEWMERGVAIFIDELDKSLGTISNNFQLDYSEFQNDLKNAIK